MRVAEFFAGIGLVRLGLEQAGFDVVYANDIEEKKRQLYAQNFNDKDYSVADIRDLHGADIPDVDVATASFPCTDLSLAGMRAGLAGEHSGMFWEFARVIEEMGVRKPRALMLENVPSFASSHGGKDLYEALQRLNELGYSCEILQINARLFVPQSRPRLFIVGALKPINHENAVIESSTRPQWLESYLEQHQELNLHMISSPLIPDSTPVLDNVVESFSPDHGIWWDEARTQKFVDSLSSVQRIKLDALTAGETRRWGTAYRRTRNNAPVWEIRSDRISGCLRTARGGSSKQAIVEGVKGVYRVRWMTPKEYARLQGADNFRFDNIPDNQAFFAFGDAVCVPVIAWVAENHIRPVLEHKQANIFTNV